MVYFFENYLFFKLSLLIKSHNLSQNLLKTKFKLIIKIEKQSQVRVKPGCNTTKIARPAILEKVLLLLKSSIPIRE